ncbi:MAG: sll0787 family AIR synthase-like protein [Bacteroidota bacterium]
MSVEDLRHILNEITQNPHLRDKAGIKATYDKVGPNVSLPETYPYGAEVMLGDDCTAIPDGANGHLLFASEGIISAFLERDPWFAGYCSVMVNISDVLAMGGLPIAVTDVIWGEDKGSLDKIWEGMVAASVAYDVPIVGGHTCYRSPTKALAVSILGRAQELLSSFNARPDQHLLMAVDMKADYYRDYPFWNASTHSSSDRLRANLTIMQEIANRGLCSAAKDISMGGLLGTVAMLGNTSEVGFDLYFDQIIPAPDGDWYRWLIAFPSFGFVLTCDSKHVAEVRDLFDQRDIRCDSIGLVRETQGINLWKNDSSIKFL